MQIDKTGKKDCNESEINLIRKTLIHIRLLPREKN